MNHLDIIMQYVENEEHWILATKSYREKCINQGFTESVADMMCTQFHEKLMRLGVDE